MREPSTACSFIEPAAPRPILHGDSARRRQPLRRKRNARVAHRARRSDSACRAIVAAACGCADVLPRVSEAMPRARSGPRGNRGRPPAEPRPTGLRGRFSASFSGSVSANNLLPNDGGKDLRAVLFFAASSLK
ncbi:hypothetical protein Bcep1808_3636 [Burkholderia vietnamiensis G4]|uniref:Uncharacterized protein n=1 Tax=Burkholderia vietnamiensis (strain G4 / LMG 22486) TaxID=269482 RepID=A4JK18_BURVG|nr:hypothetical protein Bcep1808_3636 [Burkholderia vietnamiensis G4]